MIFRRKGDVSNNTTNWSMGATSFAHQRWSDREKAENAVHVRETIGFVLAFLLCVTVAAVISESMQPITSEPVTTDSPAGALYP
jgi:hypothetical protein